MASPPRSHRRSFFNGESLPANSTLGSALLILLACSIGCRTEPPIKPLDLSEPGWTLRQGQALWIPRSGANDLAGELLVATHPNGSSFLQFTKTPLPLVVAQTSGNRWRIQFVAENQTFSGHGRPPSHFLWLHLAPCLLGRHAMEPVLYQNEPGGAWSLTNLVTGESIRGILQVSGQLRSHKPSDGSQSEAGAPSCGSIKSFRKQRTSDRGKTQSQTGFEGGAILSP